MKVIRSVFSNKEVILIFVLIIMFLGIGYFSNVFFSLENIQNMLRISSYTIIIGLGMMICLISGGIDLSVGSVMGLGGLLCSEFVVNLGMPLSVSIIISLLFAILFGYMNGLIVVKLKVPPFIATLGTMYIARGIIYVITQGTPVYPLPDDFVNLGAGTLFGFSYSVWFAIALAVIIHILMKTTKYGRHVYAIGGNAEVARLAGIKVNLVKISAYIATAIGATISGIFVTGTIGAAQVATGTGWELAVIAACVIGGVSTLGGEGSVLGTVTGVLLMVVMQTGMVILHFSAYWQNIFVGGIMIAIVALDQFNRKRQI